MNSKLLYASVATLTVLNGVVSAAGAKCSVGFEAGKVCAGSGDMPKDDTAECAASPCVEDDFKQSSSSNCCKPAEYCTADGTKALETVCSYSGKGRFFLSLSSRRLFAVSAHIFCFTNCFIFFHLFKKYPDSEGNSVRTLCAVGKFYFYGDSFAGVCSDTKETPKCERENTGKEPLAAKCKVSDMKKNDKGEYVTVVTECDKGKYFWGGQYSCEDKAYPCKIADTTSSGMFSGETYCGPKSSDTDEDKAGWKPEFKGACQDMSTCNPEDLKEMLMLAFSQMGNDNDEGTTPSGSTEISAEEPTVVKGLCPILIRMSSTPGKCQADCMGGRTSAAMLAASKQGGCTEEEVEQLQDNADASAEAQGIPKSSATTVMTSVAAATAMAAVFAALW
jgi:hypothetical protein